MVKHQNASTGQFVDDGQSPSVQKPDRPILRLKVQAPFKTYYDDDVYSLSAVNATGPFDVLPGHHNFISILQSSQLNIDGTSGQQKIIIDGGVIHVKANHATIFLDV